MTKKDSRDAEMVENYSAELLNSGNVIRNFWEKELQDEK